MGLLDWFRRNESDQPETILFPSLRPPPSQFWCDAVFIDDTGLMAISARGLDLRLEFADLDRVAIRTTDEGPGAEDVYWVLSSGEQQCLIAHGGPGEAELFERLLKLPGFNSQVMIDALTSTENTELECWVRQ